MEPIKPIETIYKNHRFRSRLECRWAIFFDIMEIEWQYELDGYNLNGTYYLPDFYLPKFDGGMFVEVKAQRLTEVEYKKAELLCSKTQKQVLLCEGIPAFRTYRYMQPQQRCNQPGHKEFINDYLDQIRPVHECIFEPSDEVFLEDGLIKSDRGEEENRMYYSPYYANADGTVHESWVSDWYKHAIHTALTARFEHGEAPVVIPYQKAQPKPIPIIPQNIIKSTPATSRLRSTKPLDDHE